MYPPYPLLLVDDEEDALRTQGLALELQGIDNVLTCHDSRQAMDMIATRGVEIVVLDILMPHVDGLELHELLSEEHPEVTVILLTGVPDVSTAVLCMKRGAFDYLCKPLDPERLVASVRRAVEYRSAQQLSGRLSHSMLHRELADPGAFESIVTVDPGVLDIFRYIEAIGPTDLPVLITGETGVGKELFAQAIHRASGRDRAFVPLDCAGIDDHFLSDTLFGHVRNAFTGAASDRDGLIRQAENGTLFLDEIGDMQMTSQVKLLRLLQERTYYKIGADVPETSGARIVAASNVDLGRAQAEGRLRLDLFYRLQSHHIHIPPLRERKDDIPCLLAHFLVQTAERMGKRPPTAPPELALLLMNYGFPGNVRELEGMVADAVSRHQGRMLSCKSFKEKIGAERGATKAGVSGAGPATDIRFPDPLPDLRRAEAALVAEALKRSGGNKTLAASILGITRKTLRAKALKPDEEA